MFFPTLSAFDPPLLPHAAAEDARPDPTDDFSSAELRQINADIMRYFPAEAGSETRVVLMEVNREQVHVYWHTSDEEQALPLVLRLHDVAYMDFSGANPHATREIMLDAPTGRCYLDVPGGNKTLLAELGQPGAYRELRVLARSAPLRLPPGSSSTLYIPPAQLGQCNDRSLARHAPLSATRFPLTDAAHQPQCPHAAAPPGRQSAVPGLYSSIEIYPNLFYTIQHE